MNKLFLAFLLNLQEKKNTCTLRSVIAVKRCKANPRTCGLLHVAFFKYKNIPQPLSKNSEWVHIKVKGLICGPQRVLTEKFDLLLNLSSKLWTRFEGLRQEELYFCRFPDLSSGVKDVLAQLEKHKEMWGPLNLPYHRVSVWLFNVIVKQVYIKLCGFETTLRQVIYKKDTGHEESERVQTEPMPLACSVLAVLLRGASVPLLHIWTHTCTLPMHANKQQRWIAYKRTHTHIDRDIRMTLFCPLN